MSDKDIIIGIDAGTSVIKSVAFDLLGTQIGMASRANSYITRPDGTAVQSLAKTWSDCVATLIELGEQIPGLKNRLLAISVTAQGDGTWLIDKDGEPVGDGWLWLDARSAGVVSDLKAQTGDRARFLRTGTGLNSCQQGTQLRLMKDKMPEELQGATTAFHCKDWLYFKLTGKRATDPSEACFTFGNYQTRAYDEEVIDFMGLSELIHLLPPIVDGSKQTAPLSDEAAKRVDLFDGTPVSLGYVDVVCTAIGAGVFTGKPNTGCSIIGSTGMHMRALKADQVTLNAENTGYVMLLPIKDMVAMIQSNMAATLNIDWVLELGIGLARDLGYKVTRNEMLAQLENWISATTPGEILYQPYISSAGERGPFVDNNARAGFLGLSSRHSFGDLMRAVLEGLGLAAMDCYTAMGAMPDEIRLSGGAAKSKPLRQIFAAATNTAVSVSHRAEAGAAGAAMIAAVAGEVYPSMEACINEWVTPSLSAVEQPDGKLVKIYKTQFPNYLSARKALSPIWSAMNMKEDL